MADRSTPDADLPSVRPRFLLVEDDEELSTMLSRLLSEEGYAVNCAEDGQRALHRGLVASSMSSCWTGRYRHATVSRC